MNLYTLGLSFAGRLVVFLRRIGWGWLDSVWLGLTLFTLFLNTFLFLNAFVPLNTAVVNYVFTVFVCVPLVVFKYLPNWKKNAPAPIELPDLEQK